MADERCARCGQPFQRHGPFVTCPGCRRPDTVERSGCRRYYEENPLFHGLQFRRPNQDRPKRRAG